MLRSSSRCWPQFENGEQSVVILNTPSGLVAVPPGATVNSPASETASVVVRREGSNQPIDTTSAGEPSTVEPGAAPEGITAVARLIAQHTGMGAGAATTLLPLLCLLLAGGAAAVVVLPLGFSRLSLAAGFLVFTLVLERGRRGLVRPAHRGGRAARRCCWRPPA